MSQYASNQLTEFVGIIR